MKCCCVSERVGNLDQGLRAIKWHRREGAKANGYKRRIVDCTVCRHKMICLIDNTATVTFDPLEKHVKKNGYLRFFKSK